MHKEDIRWKAEKWEEPDDTIQEIQRLTLNEIFNRLVAQLEKNKELFNKMNDKYENPKKMLHENLQKNKDVNVIKNYAINVCQTSIRQKLKIELPSRVSGVERFQVDLKHTDVLQSPMNLIVEEVVSKDEQYNKGF